MTKPVAAAGGPEPKGERIALFRYRLIAEALSPRLTPREPGQLVREIASRLHEFPMGTVSRGTLDRWIRDYRARNLAGLEPQVRADAGVVRRHPLRASRHPRLPARRSVAQAWWGGRGRVLT